MVRVPCCGGGVVVLVVVVLRSRQLGCGRQFRREWAARSTSTLWSVQIELVDRLVVARDAVERVSCCRIVSKRAEKSV